MTIERAREIAAQCWCDPRTETVVMNPALAEVFAEVLLRQCKSHWREAIRIYEEDEDRKLIGVWS